MQWLTCFHRLRIDPVVPLIHDLDDTPSVLLRIVMYDHAQNHEHHDYLKQR